MPVEAPEQHSLEEIASQQNHYVKHLAEVNKTNEVIATQDIINQNGLLVAREGSRINDHVADRIIQHRLIQPLEEQINLKDLLDSDKLSKAFNALMDKYPDVHQIHSDLNLQKTLNRFVGGNILHLIILQELSVMHERLPGHFEKALFCSWLAVLIATELELPEDLIKVAFIAGLVADIGLLHISPDILNKKGDLDPAERRAIQSHVVIGQLMMKKIAGENSLVARAILEHHERHDGGGYPVGKTDKDLDTMGQIIGIANFIQAIRVNKFEPCGRNLKDILPYLKINQYTQCLEIHNVIISTIQNSRLKPSRVNPLGDMTALVSHLKFNGKKLQSSVVLMKQLMEQSEPYNTQHAFDQLIRIVQPVLLMIRSSGLVNQEIIVWLKTLEDTTDNTNIDDLLEMELMQNELYWQLTRVCKNIKHCMEDADGDVSQEYREYLKKKYGQINGFLSRIAECMQTLNETK
jgi:HD-GYP domain-containing protein (c-di-GMP phosphodiesterase class II)